MQALAFDFARPASRPQAGFKLRPYQVEASKRIFEELKENRSTLLVLPTGTGKTATFADVAAQWPGKVLILAHRYELVDQARRRIAEQTGEDVDVEQAQESFASSRSRIVVGSVQTMFREKRLSRFPSDHFGLVIVDEAHHYVSPSFRAPLEYFKAAKILGVTATPDRGDRLALGQVFESVAYVYDIADAIRDQWLVPVVPITVPMEGLDLSSVDTVAGDLNQGQLDDELAKVTEGVAKAAFAEAGTRQTVIFTTSVDNAKAIAVVLNAIRPGCAREVNGKTPPEERRIALRAYAKGEAQFLVNVGIATEGWDDPPTSCVVIGRPTKSRSLFAQMIGRGLRLFQGKKDCLVIDLGGNAGRHSLVSPLDVLAGKYSDEEVALAKEITKNNRGIQAHEALEQARQVSKERAALKAKYEKRSFDIFSTFEIERDGMDFQFGRKDPTPGQMELLKKWEGWNWLKVPEDLSRRDANAVITKIINRQKHGWASPGQVRALQKYGIGAGVRKDAASNLLDAIKANGWKALPKERVSEILDRGRDVGAEG